MKNLPQSELIELNTLLKRFSVHIERKLIMTFLDEYKKRLINLHHKLPQNAILAEKVRQLEQIENDAETTNPGTLKMMMQAQLTEIISGLEAVEELN